LFRIFTPVQLLKFLGFSVIHRNKVFLFALLCFFSAKTNAQEIYTTAALTAADNTGYGYYTFAKPGFYFSIGKSQEVEALHEGRFNYGLAFSQKGARKAQDPANNDYVEYNVRLNYVEANMMFWLKMKSLKALIGLNGGYLVHKNERSVNGIPVNISSSSFRKMDISLTAGFGTMLGTKFLVQLSACYSIFPVANVNGLGRVAFSRGPRNTLVNIGFTYLFFKKAQPEEIPEEE
jgi:Outer membrane protein beta-barrel domain